MYGKYLQVSGKKRVSVLEDHETDGTGVDGLHGKMEPTEEGPNQMCK